MPEPNQTVAQPGGAQAQAQATPDAIEALKLKKGWKSNEEVVKFAEETEKSFHRQKGMTDKVKKQLETAGYTINEETGDVIPLQSGTQIPGQQPHYQVPGQQPGYGQPGYQQPGYPQVSQEPIYDPYTGQQITDPIGLQLARMPVGYREAFVVNAMLEQREKQQIASVSAEATVLSKPEAKGFEADVKAVMQALPLTQRADPKQWDDALLRVKGMRYDQALKSAGQDSVNQFIQKENIQIPTSAGADNSGVALNQEQESTYRWYQQNRPGMFKDRAHFLKNLSPSQGR